MAPRQHASGEPVAAKKYDANDVRIPMVRLWIGPDDLLCGHLCRPDFAAAAPSTAAEPPTPPNRPHTGVFRFGPRIFRPDG
jgi:hypothetical protein